MVTVITLVRHGQTDWNLFGRVQGRTDIPLNDTGREQARAAAETLRDGGYSAIVASPLSRAKETAEIISDALGLARPSLFDGLVERDYASAEGLTAEDLSALRRRAMGPDAETDDDVAARAASALRSAAAEHAAAGHEGPLIAVAHGGLIRVLIAAASGGALPRPGERVENGSQHVFRFHADGFDLLSSPVVATEA